MTSDKPSGAIGRITAFIDWVMIHLSPLIVIIAWNYGLITFEWAVIYVLFAIYYIQGEKDE